MTEQDSIEGYVAWDNEYTTSLTFSRYVNGEERVVDHITLDGERYERVRECENVSDDSEWLLCSNCAAESCVEYWNSGYDVPSYCPNYGAKVVSE